MDRATLKNRRKLLLQDVKAELNEALEHHGEFASAHEGYGVLMEEVREFENEVFKKGVNRDWQNMYEELVQIAAVAGKIAVTVAMKKKRTVRRG